VSTNANKPVLFVGSYGTKVVDPSCSKIVFVKNTSGEKPLKMREEKKERRWRGRGRGREKKANLRANENCLQNSFYFVDRSKFFSWVFGKYLFEIICEHIHKKHRQAQPNKAKR
jgi:hypothetical protein